MTNERKVELYNELLGYLCELVSGDEELAETLMNIGFTEDELKEECLYRGSSVCKDEL